MKAYIQKENNELSHEITFTGFLGFQNRGIDCKFFDADDIDSVPIFNPKTTSPGDCTIVLAYIEDTIKYFKRLGVKVPDPIHIPEVLLPYCQREVTHTTLGEAKKLRNLPLFIKSYDLKLFPSGVIQKDSSYDLLFPYPDDTKIITSEVLDIVSEYRIFVNRGTIVGMKHYIGDFFVFPDIEVIKNMLKDYKEAPISHTLDVGVTSDGKTVLIECQDAWSIGSYGLEPSVYTRFLIDRWIEIIYK